MQSTLAWRQMVTDFVNLPATNLDQPQRLNIKLPLATHQIRVQIANDFDDQSLQLNELTINQQPVYWQGQSTLILPAHQRRWSDWLSLPIVANQWLTVTTAVTNSKPRTLMSTKSQTIIQPDRPYFLGPCAIEVTRERPAKQLVCFGDSLTNQGYYSTALMQKLMTEQPDSWGLTNGGISGNRLLRDGHSTSPWVASFGEAGLTRLQALLASQPVDELVFMMGLNDLLHPGTGSPLNELPTALAMIAGLKQVQQLATKYHVNLWMMTITPFKGANEGAWTPAKEISRQTVNQWLLTQPQTLDVAKLVADQQDDAYLAAAFDCGDHVHFSEAGGTVVGDWVYGQIQVN
ncbi:GDSL-type esterase/lipase family protein [Lactiplantibacillus mudanjiangensis]|uniref:SGNH hydrolase-type esterase domain-containing protein n=1 Tax=Lactiplantibacillus mudanjiangensis TaxID=1296538 RepID=A0A660EA05_9LACO|nr:GDSL-type esterase/lipase family protein [Lactiplantibacillus mudanjiangensis]VDG23402.1 hypothetical protein [Lactobacillus sp. CBA3606] [Lactiplantibacillus mudanjiangensis]VDG29306.1 hypothetical protein [Lactobacillus sp. CBA3606] [Lactiplantibacillus mudanjiangensis]